MNLCQLAWPHCQPFECARADRGSRDKTRSHGGVNLARTIAVATYEQGMKERTVSSVFPIVGDAIAAYETKDYAAVLTALGDGTLREIRIVECNT